MIRRLKKYIVSTLLTDEKLNEYVPNEHIALTFCGVLEWAEYYESNEHKELFKLHNFVCALTEVFNKEKVSNKILHEIYQTLRESDNKLRIMMKEMIIDDIELGGEIMKKRMNRSSHEILEEFKKYIKK